MSASKSNTGRPPYAVVMWCDHTNIYTEIPASNGGLPYIQSWSLTEGGLTKALAQMKDLFVKDQPVGGNYQIPMNPLVKQATGINNFSADQRSAVRDILRKMKVI